MTMVPRDPISETQITAAKVMPGPKADRDDDDRTVPDSALENAAEKPVSSTTPGAPARLPGYGK